MAKLRIFVSSTCYDLGIIRSELRPFISALGYEPVMSDFSDILYDPRSHTHDSCIKEIPNCDMVILIIGSRFGGTGIPSVLDNLNFNDLKNLSSKTEILENKDKLSITQLEILKAVEQSIPVYTFIDDKVMYEHHVYEKNKNKLAVMAELEFPSIQKKDTAKYIFEFINFITHRTVNNSVTPFSKLEDIKANLLSQWSQLFQRLLYETRTHSREAKRYLDFSERIDDLKAVVMATISSPNLKDTAKGVIQFRHLITFISSFKHDSIIDLLISDSSWKELLSKLDIIEYKVLDIDKYSRASTFFILSDGTFYRSRYPESIIKDLEIEWQNFLLLEKTQKSAIVSAVLEDRNNSRRLRDVVHVAKNFNDYLDEQNVESNPELEVIKL